MKFVILFLTSLSVFSCSHVRVVAVDDTNVTVCGDGDKDDFIEKAEQEMKGSCKRVSGKEEVNGLDATFTLFLNVVFHKSRVSHEMCYTYKLLK